MADFWDSEIWGFINLVAILLVSLLTANTLKRKIKFLRVSLIPTSVLGGLLLLLLSIVYRQSTGENIFDTAFFGGKGSMALEMLTYHCLALGFIATSFKPSKERFNKKRTEEVFNTGVTTVASYLLQGIVGLAITILVAMFIMKDFFPAAGIILPFGFGQGTGQAMNYGNIYETDYGFVGGKSFGLTIAACGFLCAALGGVIHLNILRAKNKLVIGAKETAENYTGEDIQGKDEIPMNGSLDKVTVQMGFVLTAYLGTYFVMYLLGTLLPSLKSIIYGFNFLFGVLIAIAVNSVVAALRRSGLMKRRYINNFLMDRIGGFFFDLMIVAGVAAIQLDVVERYWGVILTMAAAGMVVTYFYNRFISKKLFSEYQNEQFLVMYGMLTGTASTGIMLLKEVDRDLTSLASENVVYQNLPAMVLGFPMMIVATMAPKSPIMTLLIIIAYFIVLNIVLFRSFIFKKKKKKDQK